MKCRRAAWALRIAVLVGIASAGEPNVDELLKQLEGPNPPENLEAAYGQIIDAFLPKMSSDNMGDRQAPEQTFQDLCWNAARPGAEACRLAAAKAIVARLAKPDLGKWPRVWFLKQLQMIGRAEAVDAVAALLNDKDELVRERARTALQKNPAPEATAKFVAALDAATDPGWRIALANALGDRRDKAAVPALVKLVAETDDNVRGAALNALAKIGDPTPIAFFTDAKRSDRERMRAVDACIHVAEKLVAEGKRFEALAWYMPLASIDEPSLNHLRCAGIIGIGRAGGVQQLDTIFKALADKDAKFRGAALYALGLLPGREVSEAITARMKTAAPEMKVVLLQALADGRDKEALPAFLAAATDADESVRIAAFEGMGLLRNDAAAPALVAALAKAQGKELDAVRNAIAAIPGNGITAALVKAMDGATPATKAQLIPCIAGRRTPAVAPTLLRAATDPDAAVRTEAFKALADVADEKALPDLVKMLVNATDAAERQAAERTLTTVARRIEDDDKRTEAVLAAMPNAGAPARVSLIRIAANLGGAKALAATRAAMKDASPEVQEAAFRALPSWADPSVAKELLEIAKSDASLPRRVLALRGAVDVASKVGGMDAKELAQLFEGALAAAPRPEDKKAVLGAMGGVANLGVLDLALKCMEDPALRNEAELAACQIARAVSGSYPDKAKEVLKKLVETTKNDRIRNEAKDALNVISRFEDYVAAWLVSGPYKQGDKDAAGLFDVAFPPEKDLVGGVSTPRVQQAKWRPMPIGTDKGRPWLIEFDKTPGFGEQNAVVYLRTRVYSPKKQDAQLEAGSDDGIKIWVNGKVVHANNATRPCSPGSDKAKAALNEGWNDLLAKVTQGGGEWSACLRIRAADGGKLEGIVADPSGK